MTQPDLFTPKPKSFPPPRFNGPVYDPRVDQKRLAGQYERVFNLMRDGEWRTLQEISGETGAPEASASAQLRHAKKPRFGGHTVNKRRRNKDFGTWEYSLIENK